ncbi:winged helix-turn-helix domain-containing protein [Sphingobium sp.]|uniref:winged helix-turn-helix domain-containing protein n=1 Tax=Sphingobium sp. TaxID=1912891 RepID=UPI002CF39165|nr:winged helix-turn-helix domain-containing protein [Sphingobium sp.]HUD93708.1 winged helix-turn-helix domain-containing protein [Sphingobium sp.]
MTIYSFGEFRLDAARRELWRGEELLPAQLKVFDTLVWLIEHRKRAVGRDELIAAVWGKVDVTDNVLAQIVGRARHLVGDSGEEQRCIRTIPRFGYQWVASTQVLQEGISENDVSIVPSDPTEPKPVSASIRARFRRATALFTTAVLLAGTVALVVLEGRAPHATPTRTEAALVLPVELEADEDFSWVRLGAMQFLSQRLRSAGQPVVPDATAISLSESWHGRPPDDQTLDKLASDGGVGWLLRSQAVFSGGRWRVVLTTLGRDQSVHASGESEDVIQATRFAFQALAAKLELLPEQDDLAIRQPELAGMLQRVKAFVLANRLEEAQTLLNGLSPEQQALPDVAFQRAQIDLTAGRVDAAVETLEALLKNGPFAHDEVMRAEVLSALGDTRYRKFDFPGAWRLYTEAIAVVQRRTDYAAANLLGRIHLYRAGSASQMGRLDEAQDDFAQARVILEATADRVHLAKLDNATAMLLAFSMNRPEAALPYLTDAADRSATFSDTAGELRARLTQMSIYLLSLDVERALAQDMRVRELVVRTAFPALRQFAELMRARALIDYGRTTEARAIIKRELEHAPSYGDPGLMLLAHALNARIGFGEGQYAFAENEAEAAMGIELAGSDEREYARAALVAIRARRRAGDDHAAARQLSALHAWAEDTGRDLPRLYAAIAAAEAAAGAGDEGEADRNYQMAQTLAETIRIPLDTLEFTKSYADWLVARGDSTRASAVVNAIAPWSTTSFDAALLRLRLYHALGQITAWRSALAQTQALAGERQLPEALLQMPAGDR